MHVNKLISLQNTAYLLVSWGMCFPAATTRSPVSQSKLHDIHHIRKLWWNMFKNRKNLVSTIEVTGWQKQLSEWKKFRSSCPMVLGQKGFLKILQNSQESTCIGVFFIRVIDLSYFHVNSAKFLRTNIL